MKIYDLIVIGGGPAGMVVAKLVKGFGKKVAIVEAQKLGGDCTHTGCIPSKTLLHAAHSLSQAKQLEKFGFTHVKLSYKTENIMQHIKGTVAKIYAHETPEVFENEGIDVLKGKAKFESPQSVDVNGHIYHGKKFVIATGSGAFVPALKGIEDVNILTNENVFELERIPTSLIIVGNGVIAVEMASAFVELGSKVTVVSRSKGILKGNDEEASEIIFKDLQEKGVEFIQEVQLQSIKQDGQIQLNILQEKTEQTLYSEHILFATGRQANTQLDLHKANVDFDDRGINVSKTLHTSNPNIYAIGDVSSAYKFTHMAEQEAIRAGKNILFPFFQKAMSYEHKGWCVYTNPELAQIGMSLKEARKHNTKAKEIRHEYKNLDRAYTDTSFEGFVKIVVDEKGKILGATILGQRAGELIHQLQMAKTFHIALHQLSSMVFLYPTYSDMIKYSAKKYYLQRLFENPWLNVLKKVIGLFKKESS